MFKRRMVEKQIEKYRRYLHQEEKSQATIEKYIRDIRKFYMFLSGGYISKERVVEYKNYLIKHYKVSSVNSMLAALNCFLTWKGLEGYRVKPLKVQQRIFRPEEKELTAADYSSLLEAALEMEDLRLNLIMQTICATGIRISELDSITTESLQERCIQIICKNKTRYVWMPETLRRQLKKYIAEKEIVTGPVFVTRTGKPVSREYVWMRMKKAAETAGIVSEKVYPHNLRHLFAQTFYKINKDIIKLADILGHSNISTTRLYTMTTGKEHAIYLEKLRLVTEIT